jgi:probable HAF family extracellular repeat protein
MRIDPRALAVLAAVLLAACSNLSHSTSPSEDPTLVPGKHSGSAAITTTDLGLSGSRADSRAEDIDDQGRIVGSRGPWTGPMRAFLWTPTSPRGTTGTAVDLGAFSGGTAAAHGINASGQVVGSSTTVAGSLNSQHPFLWEGGVMHDLGALNGYDLLEAMDVNDGTPRRVAGGPSNPVDRAVVWTVSGTGAGFTVAAVDVLQGISSSGSFAFALNDAGTVVGYSKDAAGVNLPAVWTDAPTWSPHALAPLPNTSSGVAYDINTAGQIAGSVELAAAGCATRAVVWASAVGSATQLPVLSGGTCAQAMAINDAGQISGLSSNSRGAFRAVLWRPTAGGYSVTDLGQPRGTTPNLMGINEPSATGAAVEVAGFARSTSGAEHATLWTIP